MDPERRDFFVSYTAVDEERATWIADVLRGAGYSVLIQTQDFPPGSNFVLGMQQALQSSDRLIAVLSSDYLRARFTRAEWASVFAVDPEGIGRKLIPVMVQQCEPDGLLGQLVQIRIHDFDELEAKRKLLDGIEAAQGKSAQPGSFPGLAAHVPGHSRSSARSYDGLDWTFLSSPPGIAWRSVLENRFASQYTGYEAVEFHLVPVGDQARLQVRDLKGLEGSLPAHGRQHGVFTAVDALDVRSSSTEVVVTSAGRGVVAGLAVTRSGQRSAWAALPRDTLGAVLDEADLSDKVARMLDTLIVLPLREAELSLPAVGIEPAQMVSVGCVCDLPRRSAQLGHGMPQYIRPLAEEAVTVAALRTHGKEIAEELAARLAAEHKTAARIG